MHKNKIASLFLVGVLIISSSAGYASVLREDIGKQSIKKEKHEKKERSDLLKLLNKCIGVASLLGAVYFFDRAFKKGPFLKINIAGGSCFLTGDYFLTDVSFGDVSLGDSLLGVACLYCAVQNLKP